MSCARPYAPDCRARPARGTFLVRLGRDERAASVVEFGLIVIPFFALLMAILQTSLTFFVQELVQSAAEAAGRQLMTGQAQTQGMTQAQFKNYVCSRLPTFLSCANVIVDVQQANTFSGVSTTPPTVTYDSTTGQPNNGQYSPGTSGQVTVLRVTYIWPELKGPLGFDLSNLSGGNRQLIATSVFKTEPYTQ